MAEVLLRLNGVVERILEMLVKKGYYKTKSEAIRAGILELGKEYALITGPAYYRRELEKITKERKVTMKQLLKEIEAIDE